MTLMFGDARGLSPLLRVVVMGSLTLAVAGSALLVGVMGVVATASLIEMGVALLAALVLLAFAIYTMTRIRNLSEDPEPRDVSNGMQPEPPEDTELTEDEFETLFEVEHGDAISLTAGAATETFHIQGVTPAGGGRILRVEQSADHPVRNIVLDERVQSAHLVSGIGDDTDRVPIESVSLP